MVYEEKQIGTATTVNELIQLLSNLPLEAKIVVSNNDIQFVRELFFDWNIHPVEVRRSINRNGSDRTDKEVIITNF